jgi:hypothetical protein
MAKILNIHDNFCCDDMKNNIQDNILSYNEVFDEFGFNVAEDNSSVIIIEYCPWCGKKLPASQRGKWFEELEFKGFITPLFNDHIPTEYKSKKWREDR